MERKIGEVFEFNGVRLKTLRDDVFSCNSCYFSRNMNFCDDMSCNESGEPINIERIE